jgi:acetylornithine deacetylase/succinyl-diaminopimelate desuccinylase-like protein
VKPFVLKDERARLLSAGLGRSLILQAHVDVVPTGSADMWTHKPFDPVIEGDWLYGRGGADMKAGHAATCAASMRCDVSGCSPPRRSMCNP